MHVQNPPAKSDLSGKTAVITGASRGPGFAMAQALGQAGAKLMLCARQADALELACADLQAQGLDARWVAADCAREADLHKLVSESLQRIGDIDILVNAAGVSSGALTADRPLDAWDRVMALNLRGQVWLSQLVARHSMLGRGGSIIHVAPITGQGSNPADLASLARHSADAALCQVSMALAGAWGPQGIRVNLIRPGAVPGAALSGARSDCLTDAENLQGITLLLASAAGQNITGQCLALAGGVAALMRTQQQ